MAKGPAKKFDISSEFEIRNVDCIMIYNKMFVQLLDAINRLVTFEVAFGAHKFR